MGFASGSAATTATPPPAAAIRSLLPRAHRSPLPRVLRNPLLKGKGKARNQQRARSQNTVGICRGNGDRSPGNPLDKVRGSKLPYYLMSAGCMGLKNGLYIYMIRQFFRTLISPKEIIYSRKLHLDTGTA